MEECKKLRKICEEVGVSRRAIQGYEKAGLVEASERNKYGYLLYDEKAVERIKQVKLFQDFEFQISEIAEFIDAPKDEIVIRLKKQLICLNKKQERMDLVIKKAEEMIKEYEQNGRYSLDENVELLKSKGENER